MSCSHNLNAYLDSKKTEKNELIKKQNEVQKEMNEVDSCGEVLSCIRNKSMSAYKSLSEGFISNGKPYCEGGIFATQYGGLSGQIGKLDELGNTLENRKKQLQEIINAYQDTIDDLQNAIDNPPELGDCDLCKPKETNSDHRYIGAGARGPR